MKKLLWGALLLLALGALGLLPFHASDAAKLLPVKTVVVTRSGEEYVVDVGAGLRAVGRSISEALERLRELAPGELFLPTTDQVIITEPEAGAVEAVAEESEFRPATGIYLCPDPSPDPAAISAYLDSHPSNTTVLDLRAALAAGKRPVLPRLLPVEGGFLVA